MDATGLSARAVAFVFQHRQRIEESAEQQETKTWNGTPWWSKPEAIARDEANRRPDTERRAVAEAAREVVERHRDPAYSPNQRMNAIDRLAHVLSAPEGDGWMLIETAPTPHGYIDERPSFYLGRPTIWVRYAHDEGPPIALIYGHLDGAAWVAEKWMPAPTFPNGGAA